MVRTLQKLGTASNDRGNFALALRKGGIGYHHSRHIMPLQIFYARILEEHGGRRIIHFGKHAAEQLSY